MTNEDCHLCYSTRVVPVLDKRIERSPKPGNKYRSYCLHCESWLPMTSAKSYEESLHPHVLPADGDSQNPADVIPADEYGYEAETADLLEKMNGDGRANASRKANGAESEPRSAIEPPSEHEFECPSCRQPVVGYPLNCPYCNISYDWNERIPPTDTEPAESEAESKRPAEPAVTH